MAEQVHDFGHICLLEDMPVRSLPVFPRSHVVEQASLFRYGKTAPTLDVMTSSTQTGLLGNHRRLELAVVPVADTISSATLHNQAANNNNKQSGNQQQRDLPAARVTKVPCLPGLLIVPGIGDSHCFVDNLFASYLP